MALFHEYGDIVSDRSIPDPGSTGSDTVKTRTGVKNNWLVIKGTKRDIDRNQQRNKKSTVAD